MHKHTYTHVNTHKHIETAWKTMIKNSKIKAGGKDSHWDLQNKIKF